MLIKLLEQRKQQKELLPAMYNNIIQMFLKLDDLSNAKKYSAEMAEVYGQGIPIFGNNV
jgi:hypothetical protein